MQETIRFILTQFTDEAIMIVGLCLAFVLCILMIFWLYNRNRFHKLKHQIPASIVKNYLDSIIQNSTALRSSLLRGGGNDGGKDVPSVLPIENLTSIGSMGPQEGRRKGPDDGQQSAEIAALQDELSIKEKTIRDLEEQIQKVEKEYDGGGDEDVKLLREKNKSLEEKISLLESSSEEGTDPESETSIKKLTDEKDALVNERDELKEKLTGYAIIEEDLANFKRIQQENEELKKKVEELGGGDPQDIPHEEENINTQAQQEVLPTTDEAEGQTVKENNPIPEPTEEKTVVEGHSEAPEETTVVQGSPDATEEKTVVKEASPPEEKEEEVAKKKEEEKSAEELLSEFEKMLS